jgi:hypothetical protein
VAAGEDAAGDPVADEQDARVSSVKGVGALPSQAAEERFAISAEMVEVELCDVAEVRLKEGRDAGVVRNGVMSTEPV